MPRFYKSTSLLILFLFLTLHLNLYATNYYVDKFATGNNNGTSWTNAWQSFSEINWNQFEPGDILFISGGTNSTEYYETLSISGVSGSSGNPIIIRNGIDAGHNGEVIIDGQESRSRGVDMTDVNYITVEHLTIKSCTYAGGIVEEPATNIIFQNLKVLNHFRAGLYFKGTSSNYTALSDCAMRNNTLESTTNYGSSQTDNIYMQYVHNIEISGNTIKQLNTAADIHSDCIQFAYVGSFEVFNNYCYNTRWEHSQGIIIQFQRSGTTQKLYNNILDCANLNGTAAIQIGYQDQSNITTYIYGNTVYAGSSPFGIGAYNPDAIVRNNILYSNVSDGGVLYFANTLTSTSQCSNNLFYTPNDNDVVRMNGTKYTLSEWQAIGGGAGSYDSDPNFHNMNSGDFTIDEPSNAIDNGIALGAPYDKDIIGTLRPQGSGWDFGAYEKSTGRDLTPPEVTGAVLLDSITLKIYFSETLEQSSAEDENNYSISNNIDILNASLSGSEVTLQTSIHSPGSYLVTVVNVMDPAGNQIVPPNNSAEYSLVPPGATIMLPIYDVIGVTQEPNHTPIKTIDGLGALSGDPESRWAAEPMPEELIFDLWSVQKVGKTKFSFYRWNEGRIYEYSILVSNDLNNWDEVVSGTFSASQEWSIEEFQPVNVRYVKVKFRNNNESDWAGLWEAEIWGVQLTQVDPNNELFPDRYSLSQNYPNPFNPSTTIKFSLPENQLVKISVYNILGELFAELTNQEYEAGTYSIEFNGAGLASGIYFYRLQTQQFVETKKMILSK